MDSDFYVYYSRFSHFGLTTNIGSWKRSYRNTVWSFTRLAKNCEDYIASTIYNRAGSASTRNAEELLPLVVIKGKFTRENMESGSLKGLKTRRNPIEIGLKTRSWSAQAHLINALVNGGWKESKEKVINWIEFDYKIIKHFSIFLCT